MKDVIAVNLETKKVRMMAYYVDAECAESTVHMAIVRRGVKAEVYFVVPAEQYNAGDTWRG